MITHVIFMCFNAQNGSAEVYSRGSMDLDAPDMRRQRLQGVPHHLWCEEILENVTVHRNAHACRGQQH